ncbi:hypothetical protein LTR36_006286 [Oleoguttula mirabilis]|uniref:Uncharacterized protein n=1 Tax=Oleoguttula mirabilis TaxID=1507867 RepID=A0AAV9JCP4_9PEZI|nr:hypothetical protein LTR36_006286 [Oleoguttula mirabilis]
MESPPPVPPKDSAYPSNVDMDHAPLSASKRKREIHDDTVYDLRNGRLEAVDPDAHTPKRSRSHLRQSDADVSDDATPSNQRSLRRKKKVGNLSNLNLRHAAEQQARAQARDSRFQEGSLTDKPSALPPSVFRRMLRTDSGNIRQVDELMEEYYEEQAAPRDSVEAAVDQEKALISQRVQDIAAEAASKDESGGFFRFGRSLAANFHPVSLWNKLWNETKEEMTRQNMEEAEKKRRQKEEAEARYAQMKQAGQLGLQPVGNATTTHHISDETATPTDSAVVLDSALASLDRTRTASNGSQLLAPPTDDIYTRPGSEVPETASKSKTLRGRFHFKRPSMSDLKTGLKRVKSDMNLVTANRESSSSLSPVKTDFENPALRRSHSRYDLKKQTKLSKRVSNLESKLSLARQELNEALVEASPMPKLSNKYERFTPMSTLKRPKFVPGRLPTLPSERLLNPEQLPFGDDEQSPEKVKTEVEPRKALDLIEDMDMNQLSQSTLKAPRERSYPPRASSLSNLDNADIQQPPTEGRPITNPHDNETSEPTQFTSDTANMDPNSIANFTSDGAPVPAPSGDYASLDAKLKALDANVKVAKKSAKPKSKKRKSGANDDDMTFNPGKIDDDDDAEWQEANETSKKKRKPTGNNGSSPHTKRTKGAGRSSSPLGKKAVNGATKTAGKASPDTKKSNGGREDLTNCQERYSEDETKDAEPGADELANSARNSLDSQGLPLEPLYEEDEETSMVALKDEPSKPTAKATPARHGRHAVRSRSTSPNKRSGSVQALAEEEMFTRAAEVAQGRRGGRAASPPPMNGHSKVVEIVKEKVSVVPGEGDVPELPKGASGGFESFEETSKAGAEEVVTEQGGNEFEWPEDVF